ncbi:AIPR family protein [Mitsuokella jalaludinii]|uniref:AIPR family protein n=1 Tax=Mitsuokella jalaludinii TaxID=187979 RepID=UPI00055C4A41|nr:AIPR family protein [Mitsuokella jalaludinii]MCQ1534014.1 AIPR family protein [Mitsuokella jalaludinii]
MDIYEKIKNDIAGDYYKNNYSNDGERFVAWYLRNIHNLDPIEARDCITDGAGDKQIDAVYIDDQAQVVYIVQGKFYSQTSVNAEPLREVLSSWVQIKNLDALQEAANNRLKRKILDISDALKDDYEVIFELITTSSLSDDAEKDLEAYNNQLSSDPSISASIALVDADGLKFRYDEALNRARPYINYDFTVEPGKFMELNIGGTKAVIAAIPLKECIKIPGVKDGSLFRRNVRQSLGNSNKVNKGITKTIRNDSKDFFFYHNGITAICSKLHAAGDTISTRELNVVNGCQSLSTIYNCSEAVKKADNAYVLFRFYEIKDTETADKISISTNSQSAVKARDLRSNDKNVLMMKKAYEQKYPDGYFITKRGENVNTAKYNTDHVFNLTDLGKALCAWHSQRPILSYSETRIFDKNFSQLFHKDYPPENMQALKELMDEVKKCWTPDNPLGLNPAMLAMKSFMPYHHLFAISVLFDTVNSMPPDSVPNPAKALENLKKDHLIDQIIPMAGAALNMAFENAVQEAQEKEKVFSPQNWSKAKASINAIKNAIRSQYSTINFMPGGAALKKQLQAGLKLDNSDFEARWTAD